MTVREEINRLIARELHRGTPALALALAFTKHTQDVLAIAVRAQQLDRLELGRSRTPTKRKRR